MLGGKMNGSLIDLLKELLKERTTSNPQYSLRAMAKWLDVSPSELSALFTRKRNLTVKMVDHFSRPLKLLKECEELLKEDETVVHERKMERKLNVIWARSNKRAIKRAGITN
jgi:AraC-like DNA-binding protein